MAERDPSQKQILFSDIPGDVKKVKTILALWGVEEASIRRLMRERRTKRAMRTLRPESEQVERRDTD